MTYEYAPPDVAAISFAHDELLNEKQAARYLNVAAKTLQNLRWKGGGPVYVKLTRLVRYRVSDLKAFVDTNTRFSTSDRS